MFHYLPRGEAGSLLRLQILTNLLASEEWLTRRLMKEIQLDISKIPANFPQADATTPMT